MSRCARNFSLICEIVYHFLHFPSCIGIDTRTTIIKITCYVLAVCIVIIATNEHGREQADGGIRALHQKCDRATFLTMDIRGRQRRSWKNNLQVHTHNLEKKNHMSVKHFNEIYKSVKIRYNVYTHFHT